MATSTSKFGGTRIPFNKLDTLPALKINEAISIHEDGSVRYFSIGNVRSILTDDDVVAVVYNVVSGMTLPQVVVSTSFVFDSSFHKCLMSLRVLLARYVKRSFFNVSTYSAADATFKQVGTYKTAWSVEFGLRSAL